MRLNRVCADDDARICGFANKLERPDDAIELWGELYEVNAGPALRESLEALGTTPERARVISNFLTQGTESIFDPELKQTELSGLARFQEFVVEDYSGALETQRKVLQVGDGTDDGYESISRLLMRLAPAGDGAAYFRGQVQEAVNPRERAVLHLSPGRIKMLRSKTRRLMSGVVF